MAIIKGVKNVVRRLMGMRGDRMETQLAAALYAIGQEIELEAERSITEGAISGKDHVVSAAGEPPNADTGNLDRNIETIIISNSPPKVTVESYAPYSGALEYGTSKMAERPFMRPAVAKVMPKSRLKIDNAVRGVVRGA